MTKRDSVVSALRQLCIIAFISLALYAVIDTGFVLLHSPKPYAAYRERLAAPAYAGERYFSEEFLAESFAQPGRWDTPPGTRLVFPAEFHGKFFNVDILPPTGFAYRRTLNPARPESAQRVLLLGGSTIYNSEVPDEYTIASQMARSTGVDKGRARWILNAGVTSVNSLQELERLKAELRAGLKPDVVLTFNGVNDALQGVYLGGPEDVMFENASRKGAGEAGNSLKERLREHVPAPLLEAIRKVRATVTLRNIYDWMATEHRNTAPRTVPPHLNDPEKIEALAKKTGELYQQRMLEMQALSEQYKFRFILVLQPSLYSADYVHRTADLSFAREHESRRLPKVESAFRAAYPKLRSAIAYLRQRGVDAHDLSGVLAPKAENVFLDSHHVNSVGNRMIADALAGILQAPAR